LSSLFLHLVLWTDLILSLSSLLQNFSQPNYPSVSLGFSVTSAVFLAGLNVAKWSKSSQEQMQYRIVSPGVIAFAEYWQTMA